MNPILILMLLLNYALAQCPYPPNTIEPLPLTNPYYQIDVQMEERNTYPQFGYAVWFKYQPMAPITLLNGNSQSSQGREGSFVEGGPSTKIDKQLIHIEQNQGTTTQLIHYVTLDREAKTIKNVLFFIGGSIQTVTFPMDILKYEGVWYLIHILYLNEQVKARATFFRSLDSNVQQQLVDFVVPPLTGNWIRFITGGTLSNYEGGLNVNYGQFKGRISKIILTDSIDIANDLSNFQTFCSVNEACVTTSYNLVETETLFDGTKINNRITTPNNSNNYQIFGWSKVQPVNANRDSTLLRVTLREFYNDDQTIGDRVLLIQYHQSLIIAQNGLSVITYTYSYPYSEPYTSKTTDKLSIIGPQYQVAITKWHFFQFELSSTAPPLFEIVFPFLSQSKESYHWDTQRYHFTGMNLYIFYGGDKYATNLFVGTLMGLKLVYCPANSNLFQLTCHYSCATCDGPLETNCLSCSPTRVFSAALKVCLCQNGYIDIKGELECTALTELYPSVSELQVPVPCNSQGFDICEGEKIQCSFGYFLFNKKCVRCPEQAKTSTGLAMFCGNCLLRPQSWANAPQCTWDLKAFESSPVFNYQNYTRTSQESTFYKVELEGMEVKTVLQVGFAGSQTCKQGYFQQWDFKAGSWDCLRCPPGFLDCTSSKKVCEEGYALLEAQQSCEPCTSCPICEYKNGVQVCKSCYEGQFYIQAQQQCIQCGYKCASCTPNRCLYCVDPEAYFISFDGINCQPCNLDNCKYCFHHTKLWLLGNVLTTIDQQFTQMSGDAADFKVGCMYCLNGKYLSQSDFFCKDKIVNPWSTEPTSTTGGGAPITCTTGFTTTENQNFCLISPNDPTAIQGMCSSIVNCAQCIQSFQGLMAFCMLCNQGYYAVNSSGLCQACPSACATCIEQNSSTKDGWRWDIRAFYKIQLDRTGSHPYLTFGVAASTSYEVTCKSCQPNYILSNGQCIQGCDPKCKTCKVISGSAVCIDCFDSLFNNVRSIQWDKPSLCNDCMEGCSACASRLDSPQYNTVYNPQFGSQKYKQFCLESEYFLDSFGLITQCTSGTKCMNQIRIEFNVYCNDAEMNAIISSSAQPAMAAKKNIVISRIVESFDSLEKEGLYQYLNSKSIRKIDYLFTIIFNEADICFLPYNMKLDSQFKKNVYSVSEVNIEIKGRSTTKLYIADQMQLLNFNTIKLSNLHFDNTARGVPGPIKLLFIENSQEQTKIILENIGLITVSSISTQLLAFKFENVQKLQIINFSVSNAHIRSLSQFFQINSNYKAASIEILGFKISSSSITQSNFFIFKNADQAISNSLTIRDLSISETSFTTSTFILTSATVKLSVLALSINSATFKTVSFSECTFINAPLLLQGSLSAFLLEGITFDKNSTFIASGIINIENLVLQSSVINSGQFITNTEQFATNGESLDNTQGAKLTEITFKSIKYFVKQSLIQINQYTRSELKVTITKLELNDVSYGQTPVPTQASYFLASIFISATHLTVNSYTLLRAPGYPEMALIISQNVVFQTVYATLLEKYFTKTLHPSFSCVDTFINRAQYFLIYIGDYSTISFENIIMEGLIAVNHPFIMMQSKSLMKETVNELITIKNLTIRNSLFLVTQTNRFAAGISIFSDQSLQMTIVSSVFQKNHLNSYVQDLTQMSAATLLLQLKQGFVFINNTLFDSNLVTNSTNSILHITTYELKINSTQFTNNNIIRIAITPKYVLGSDVDLEDFKIMSESGSGKFIASVINFNLISIIQSFAVKGGGFNISPQGDGYLTIQNSQFTNTKASLASTDFSQGGLLYIDGSKAKINFLFKNIKMATSWSRLEGGAIYIIPSLTYNSIQLIDIEANNVFSLYHGFLSITCVKTKSLISQVTVENLKLSNPKAGYEEFLGQITELADQEISNNQHSNPLIYSKFTNFTILNSKFQDCYLQQSLSILQSQSIYIYDLTIDKITFLFQPQILISLIPATSSNLFLERLQVSHVAQIANQSTGVAPCGFSESDMNSGKIQTCVFTSPTFSLPNEADISEYNSECNKRKIFQTSSYNHSVIIIQDTDLSHNLRISKVTITDTYCSYCTLGLFVFQNIKGSPVFRLITLSNIEMKNNECGSHGCLSLIESQLQEHDLPDDDNVQTTTRILNEVSYFDRLEEHLKTLEHTVLIKDGVFYKNTAKIGGALFIVRVNVLLYQVVLAQNTATNYGGAAYYSGSDQKVYLLDSHISENIASLGSSIFIQNLNLPKFESLGVYIGNNQATQEKSDLFEGPASVTVSLDGGKTLLEKVTVAHNDTTLQEEIVIKPYKILGSSETADHVTFPTGQRISSYKYFDPFSMEYIPYNLTFRIILLNRYNERQSKYFKGRCTLSPSVKKILTNKTLQVNTTETLSSNNFEFNETTGDFNLDDLIINFDPYANEENVLQLLIQCDRISIPVYETAPPYLLKTIISQYSLVMKVKTFKCQMGEYFYLSRGACQLCKVEESQYSVSVGASYCSYKNDLTMTDISSSMVKLRLGYWRPYLDNPLIEECYHLRENCEGGWIPGDTSCTLGHIGALCEQCDLYNIRGQGSFSVTQKYSCGDCSTVTGNTLSILFVSLWTLVSILMSVSSTIEMIEQFIMALNIKAFGITVVLSKSSSGVLIKVFTNYLQIVSTISTFSLTVPTGLASVVDTVGNPIETMAYSLDCFLITVSEIKIIYFRIIWALLLAVFYILAFILLYSLAIYLKIKQYNITFITTTLIYVYIYLQPNLIGGLVSLLSFRIISDNYWIQGNVAYRYDDSQHYKWLLGFVLPALLILGAIIPFICWYSLFRKRFVLDRAQIRRIWGYLYNEYSKKAYYWETIKILQKQFMIIVLTYYEDFVPVKASLIFMILFFYSQFTNHTRPYLTGELNTIDARSTIICATSIVCASTIYSASLNGLPEIVWPLYIIIGVINFWFIQDLLWRILLAYFQKLHEHIDQVKIKVKERFPDLANSNIYVRRFMETHKAKDERIKGHYQKIRRYLIQQAKLILAFKRLNNLELPRRDTDQSVQEKEKPNQASQLDVYSPESLSSEKNGQKAKLSSAKVYPINESEKLIVLSQHQTGVFPRKFSEKLTHI